MLREVKALTTRNQNLTKENNTLKDYLKAILKVIKHFLENYYKLVMKREKVCVTGDIYENQEGTTILKRVCKSRSTSPYRISGGFVKKKQYIQNVPKRKNILKN